MDRPKVILVGCGKMGGAMLRGWLARGLAPDDVLVVEPAAGAVPDADGAGVRVVAGVGDVPAGFRPDIVVFAVKPQGMDEIVPAYREIAATGAAVLSIAAGRTIASIAKASAFILASFCAMASWRPTGAPH